MSDATEATKREGKGSSAPRQTSGDDPKLSRGTLVGRYVILDVIGEGGMGVVYAAFDPELDRKVAVKLLQASAGGSESGGQAWLMREAQAMARLSHPNVIAVHDVGTLPGDRVFVAMELVDGGTLRKWLEGEHSWREVVAVMRAAGAGLAAAHAGGLVHRDFKPDNVLVGKDGRVRVMDFGLARLHDGTARDSDLTIESKSPLSEKLTIAGFVVGTPAYMAPELYDGHAADARTDQFAFGVTLYEALYRVRPFDKGKLAKRSSELKPKPAPAGSKVPARVHKVVARAISIDPAARYASMDELLAELAIDPTASRRRVALAAGIAAGVAAALAIAFPHSKSQLCKGSDRKLAGAWDAPVKETIQHAFAATKHVRAAQAFDSVSRVLDRYTTDWSHMAVESCEATRVHGDQTESDMALRTDCLDARVAELRALTGLFAKADSDTVDKAEKAAQGLDPIAACANLPLLRAPNALPKEQAASLAKVNEMIATAKASILANKIGAAVNMGTQTVELAKTMNNDSVLSEALMLRGTASFAGGDPFGARQDLTDAVLAAIRGKRDDVLAQSALFCAIVDSQTRRDDVAQAWLSIGIAAASRITGDRVLEMRRYQTEGIVMARAGNARVAITADEKALALANELYGTDGGLVLAQAEQELASAYSANLEYTKAPPHLEHAIQLLEHVEGPQHPDLATTLGTLALVYAHTGELAKSRELYERAIALREKILGKDSPALVPTLNNVADLLHKNGDAAGALPYIERAMPLAKKFGPKNPMYQTVATTEAEIMFDVTGREAEARKLFDELLAAEDSDHSIVLGATLVARTTAENHAHEWLAAAAFGERAVAALEATGGKDAPTLWPALAALAEAKAGLGKKEEAKTLFDRAFALAKSAQTSESDLAAAKAAYAKL